MYKGTVTLSARIRGNGITFPSCEFTPSQPGVDKVEIECPKGDAILSTVHLASVATHEDGIAIATKVHKAALDRISFHHSIAIEKGEITGSQFSPLDPPSDAHLSADAGTYGSVGCAGQLAIGIPSPRLKAELEQASPPGEQYYGFLRSARQSMSPVEEFVHVYNLLLMLCSYDDRFSDIDAFIRSQVPAVPQTPSPRPPHPMETVYTRLRHELGHSRTHGNLDSTKAEITDHLNGLIAVTKRAIESHT